MARPFDGSIFDRRIFDCDGTAALNAAMRTRERSPRESQGKPHSRPTGG